MTLICGTGRIFVPVNVTNLFTQVKAVILQWSLNSLVIVKGHLFNSLAADLR